MLKPEELREEARWLRREMGEESNIHLKLRLANHALALVQLAEKIERQEKNRQENEVA